ncbi:nuclear transport factor 2 family protein [Conexibacter woesei]|uniref:nuclear transport factor 2 family protein n=1 Tax=Conexibacter woesei TaxID=191495 RepID=UPI00041919CE|nr:nuclear transport factor 2 family protein [Conexibacter woesei]
MTSTLSLTDRAELTDLVSRLGRWLDDGATGDPAVLFADDVRVSTPGGDSTGVAAIVDQAQRNHDAPTQHVIANVLADIDGDAAHVTANMVVTFADTETQLRRTGGTYAFDATRTAAGWRFASITVRRVWREG